MPLLRSAVFNVLFYALILGIMLVMSPVFLLPRRIAIWVPKTWGILALPLMRAVLGLRVEFRGLEHLPREGGVILAAKHQSILETFALPAVVPDFTFILKRELMWLPFFGWYLAKTGMLPVDRQASRKAGAPRGAGDGPRPKPSAMGTLGPRVKAALAEGRSLIIFPEGTRRAPGAPPAYRAGVARLYAETGASVVPVALDTGVFWPRRSFVRRRGTTVIEFLPPIPPGLPRDAFQATLEARIEEACARLIERAVPEGRLAPEDAAAAAAARAVPARS